MMQGEALPGEGAFCTEYEQHQTCNFLPYINHLNALLKLNDTDDAARSEFQQAVVLRTNAADGKMHTV